MLQAGTRHGVDEGPVAAQAVLLHNRLLQRLISLGRGVDLEMCGEGGLCGDVRVDAVPLVLMQLYLELGRLALQQNGVYTCVQVSCSHATRRD